MTTNREHLIREAEGAAHRGQKQCPGCGEWFNSLAYQDSLCSRCFYVKEEWELEAMRHRERVRRADEADGANGFYQQEEENE